MACSNAAGCVGGGCKNCSTPKETFGRGGPLGTGTLWAEGDNLFQRICFSPPFTTGCNQSVNCIDTIATSAGCVYDAECPGGQRCKDAVCTPNVRTGPQYQSNGSYGSFAMGNSHATPTINPQGIDSFSYNDPRLLQHLPAPFGESMASAQKFLETTCPSSPGLLYTQAADAPPGLVCPLFPGYVKERNCQNCIQTLAKCNMLSGFLSKEQYDECKKRESCFQYDIALPNGILHPVGYRMTPECVAVARDAITQCSHDCSPVTRPYF